MTHYKQEVRLIKGLIPYVNNSRTHSDDQVNQIASSIKEFGFTSPILIDEQGGVIAGHGRIMAAKKLGLEDAPCIILDGLTEAQKKAYIIADNQLPMNAEWDLDRLKLEIENLEELDFDISLLGFDDDFLDGLMFDEIEEDLKDEDNPYTDKVEGLYYEPSDELVKSSDTYDESKVKELLAKIELSDVTSAEKRLLTVAATRHYEFNYSKIADLYASSNEEMQELMEQSALIIVDYDKAIKNGYAKLKTAIKEDYEKSL